MSLAFQKKPKGNVTRKQLFEWDFLKNHSTQGSRDNHKFVPDETDL